MSHSHLFRRSYRIAVLGGFGSGKTVFTTALLNHIKHHDPTRLKLGRGSTGQNGPPQIIFDKELERYGTAQDLDRFEYETYRSQAATHWPSKTKVTAAYRCRFFRSDWTTIVGDLLVVDIPGERYADIPMARRSFSQWSQWLLAEVFTTKDNRPYAEAYLNLLSGSHDLNDDIVMATYKSTLARFYQSYRPFVTPSTFLLTDKGAFRGVKIFRENDISETVCGLTSDSQFAPLSAGFQATNPALYAKFERSYEDYREKLVLPLCSALKSVNQVVVLVDVTSLLAGNTAMKNGYRLLLDQVLEVLSPGCSLLGRIGNAFASGLSGGHLDGSGIEKVAVVATKADKVLRTDYDSNALTKLLRSMVGSICDRHCHRASGLTVKYFAVAGARSAYDVPKDPSKKRGRLEGSDTESVYHTSPLPEAWPSNWDEGCFSFPEVEPRFPDDEQQAPDHLQMEEVMGFLLDF
jgi:predicted YcjX-like family ATPase